MLWQGGSRWLAAVLAVVAIGGAGCGGDDQDDAAKADGVPELPAGVVAAVGDQEIATAELERHTELLVNGTSGARARDTERLRREALTKLLLQAGVEAEAAERGIDVPDAPLRRQVARIKSRYPDRAAFYRFLGGLDERDLLLQLRLSALSAKLLADVKREQGGTASAFVERIPARWRDRTTCRAEFRDVRGCGSYAVSERAAVRRVVDGMYRALAAGDAAGVCAAMSRAARSQIAQNPPGGSTDPVAERSCAKSIAVLVDTASRGGALPRAGSATVTGVKIQGDVATATVSIDGQAGQINLVRDGDVWRFAQSALQPSH